MSDCSNGEIRDLLPDLVRDGLAAADRARVESHVGECADCTDEVTLLRAARRSLSAGVPAVNVAGIVRALPSPRAKPAPGVVSIESARRVRERSRFVGWRRAAAVAAIAAGVTTVAVMNGRDQRGATGPGGTVARGVARGAAGSGAESAYAVAPVAPGRQGGPKQSAGRDAGISMAGGVADLSDDALASLIAGIDDIDAAPGTEPAVLIPEITGEEND